MSGRIAVFLRLMVFMGVLGFAYAGNRIKKGVEMIYKKNEAEPQKFMSASLCVKPLCDFDGVWVEVEHELHEENPREYLSVTDCNLISTEWNPLKVEARVEKDDNSSAFMVKFTLAVDSCVQTKNVSYKYGNITRLTVSPAGATEWLLNGPCPETTREICISGQMSSAVMLQITALLVIVVIMVEAVQSGVAMLMKRKKWRGRGRKKHNSVTSLGGEDTKNGTGQDDRRVSSKKGAHDYSKISAGSPKPLRS